MPSLVSVLVSLSVIVATVILVLLLYSVIFPLVRRLGRYEPSSLVGTFLISLRLPVALYVALLGLYLAITIPFNLSDIESTLINKFAFLCTIAITVLAISVEISKGCLWYIVNIAPKTPTILDDRIMPLVRRVAVLVVIGIGGLQILDQLGINISPLLAGLGLGGLAVALALQPTLSNIFSGTYVMTEGVVSPGDYIEMEGGLSGYVIDVSWRSTRLRTWENNLVVVPNSRFAESIITNYQSPSLPMNILVRCGVSYDSDLDSVEAISKEVTQNVIGSDSNAVEAYGSWFGFDNFGDSNVDFWIFIQARDRLSSFALKSNLIKHLHRRFSEEGIVINYPVRTLQFPERLLVETHSESENVVHKE